MNACGAKVTIGYGGRMNYEYTELYIPVGKKGLAGARARTGRAARARVGTLYGGTDYFSVRLLSLNFR